MNDYNKTASVSEIFITLKWYTLEKRRDSILMCKIIHNMVDINAQEYLIPRTIPISTSDVEIGIAN